MNLEVIFTNVSGIFEWIFSFISTHGGLIAVFSLLVSLNGERRATKKLDVVIDKKTTPIKHLYSNHVDSNGTIKQKTHPFDKPYNQIIDIMLINPSSTAISYFDLSVINLETGEQLDFPTEFWSKNLPYKNISYAMPGHQRGYRFMPPPDLHACLPGNTCLKMTLAIQANKGDKLSVSFKICKSSWRKIKKLLHRSNYKTYRYTLSVEEDHSANEKKAIQIISVIHDVFMNGGFPKSTNITETLSEKNESAPPKGGADETDTNKKDTPAARTGEPKSQDEAQEQFNESEDPEEPPEF